jgi:RND family efflux transporter MFP subunit
MAKQRAGRRKWALAAVGAVALGGMAAAAGLVILSPAAPAESNVSAEAPAQPVRVTHIRFHSAAAVASYTGTIRPRHEVALGFRVAGKVISRTVDVGDSVTKGQVVARLDDTDARLQLDQAAAEAEAARVDHDRARAEVIRSRTLFAAGHVAQATLDRATSAEAEAASRADRANRSLELARNALGYSELVADADGIVTATEAEVGQVLAAGQPVVSVAETGAVDVVFALPEQDRASLDAAEARAELWGTGGKSYALQLRDISPDVDPAGRTYRVRMTVLAPDGQTALGRTVTVQLALGMGEPVASVPLAAVLNDGTGTAVWRLAGEDRVERVAVELVEVTGQAADIRGPLQDGDVIVSLGAHKLDPARKVRAVETYQTPES